MQTMKTGTRALSDAEGFPFFYGSITGCCISAIIGTLCCLASEVQPGQIRPLDVGKLQVVQPLPEVKSLFGG